MSLQLLYNFNENDTATIRDFSAMGWEGIGANLTIAASGRVGNDGVFNSITDQINAGVFTGFNGSSAIAIALSIRPQATTGTKQVITRSGQLSIDYDGTTLRASLTVASGAAQVSAAIDTASYYDVHIIYVSDTLYIYVDNVLIDSDATQNGVVATPVSSLYFGDSGGTDGANFLLNEVKFYDNELTADNRTALINQQGGILNICSVEHGLAVGDLVATKIEEGGTIPTAVVTYVGTADRYNMQPLQGAIASGLEFYKVGHLWDTTEDHFTYIDKNSICFYDEINAPSDILLAANQKLCISKDGIRRGYIDISTTYTILGTEKIIFFNTSGGSFTTTLPADPDDKTEITIIDQARTFNSYPLTINPNGKNIDGQSENYLAQVKGSSLTLFYKKQGSNVGWFII